jgi:hypothetical protein
VVLSNIALYALTHSQGVAYINTYYSVLFMVTCFYPFRYSVYGLFTAVKAYEAYCRVDDEFAHIRKEDLTGVAQEKDEERHVFAENVGDCF